MFSLLFPTFLRLEFEYMATHPLVQCWIRVVIHTSWGFNCYCPMKTDDLETQIDITNLLSRNCNQTLCSWNSQLDTYTGFCFRRNDTSCWYQILHFLISSSFAISATVLRLPTVPLFQLFKYQTISRGNMSYSWRSKLRQTSPLHHRGMSETLVSQCPKHWCHNVRNIGVSVGGVQIICTLPWGTPFLRLHALSLYHVLCTPKEIKKFQSPTKKKNINIYIYIDGLPI